MLRVSIEVIPHRDEHNNLNQAYETTGDWGFTRDEHTKIPSELWIKVSDTGDWRYTMLVGLHEFVEAILCEHDGVYEDRVNAFDIQFEAERLPGNDDEPGDDPQAPYYFQHQIATVVERFVALMLGVNWDEYSLANDRLNAKYDHG